jgi:thiosulfate dehydrogenase (quinone) large subunit
VAAATQTRPGLLHDPTWVRNLFGATEYAWIWLIARVYMGWEFWNAGWGKTHSSGWMGGGTALKSSWENMFKIPATGHPAAAYDWYRNFIHFMYNHGWWTWFAKLVACGECAVGLGLLVGCLTGIAALFGGFMNWNFAMGGLGPSSNALLIVISVGIFMAWKTAGWWGVDRWLLPQLGTPWQPGSYFGHEVTPESGPIKQNRIEQWIRMAIGAAVAIYALWSLEGAVEILILIIAGLFVAVTGLGWFSVMKIEPKAPAAPSTPPA